MVKESLNLSQQLKIKQLNKIIVSKLLGVHNKKQVDLSSYNFNQCFIISILSWNLMGTIPQIQNINKLVQSDVQHDIDIIIINTQECQRSLAKSFIFQKKKKWQALLTKVIGNKYINLKTNVLNGLHSIIFVKNKHINIIHSIKINYIKLGFCCQLMGNKGAICNYILLEISFYLGNILIRNINVHLIHGHHYSNKRLNQLSKIIKKMCFQQDILFLSGDLNFRIQLDLNQFHYYCFQENFHKLLVNDQFSKYNIFKNFLNQGKIQFPPTYKLKTDQNVYLQQKIPGWTDRILYNDKINKLKLIDYDWIDIRGSDHRPIKCMFSLELNSNLINTLQMEIKIKNQQKYCSIF